MKKIDNSISLEEAAARRGVSKRRITQQVTEGGWGIRKIDRNQYVLSEDEKTPSALNKIRKFSDQYRLEYENSIRERLDLTQDPNERIYLICILAFTYIFIIFFPSAAHIFVSLFEPITQSIEYIFN